MHPIKSTSCLVICLLILAISAFNARTVAATTYEQPLYGFAWSPRQVPVAIQGSPEYAHDAVLQAMQTWNLGQTWFSNTYHVSSRPYTFVEVQQLGQSYVNVVYNQTQTRDDWGWTQFYYWWNSEGVFYKITVTISLDLKLRDGTILSALQLKSLATHELGHAIGLDHTVFSEMDLMNHLSPGHKVMVPSTLNLYALALLSEASSRNNMPKSPVTLPTNIPYETPAESAIPEMQFPMITAILVLGIAVILARRNKIARTKIGR